MPLFKRKRKDAVSVRAGSYDVTDVYVELRGRVLGMDPVAEGLDPSADGGLCAALMETGYDEAVATLVTVADGAVSLYTSLGGGVIGMGEHEGPRRAALAFLAFAAGWLDRAEPTSEFPLPAPGRTRFYFVTARGVLTVEGSEHDLGEGGHVLSPLFYKAQDVITEMRLVEEAQRSEDPSEAGT
jgi:hypothetical protein